MKNLLMTVLVAITVCATSFAQEDETENNTILDRKHEIRLDALDALAFTSLEVNYEYVLSKYSGVGAALTLNLGDLDDSFDGQKFAFTPFYRQYFLNKKEYGARGLFVEGMMQMAGGKSTEYIYEYDEELDLTTSSFVTDDWFNVGAGLAIGQKWVSNSGFVFELSAGGGRYFAGGDDKPNAFFRGGVLVGYRF